MNILTFIYTILLRSGSIFLCFRLFFCFKRLMEWMCASLQCMLKSLAQNAAIQISVLYTFHISIRLSILGRKYISRPENLSVPSFTMKYWYVFSNFVSNYLHFIFVKPHVYYINFSIHVLLSLFSDWIS